MGMTSRFQFSDFTFPISFSSHRRLGRFLVFRLRHPLIIRRRLFQQFLPRFHLRTRGLIAGSRLIVRTSASVCRQRTFARHSPLVTRHFPHIAAQRLSRQRRKVFQARQLLQIAQSKPHQKFLRRLIQNRPPHHFLPPRRLNQIFVQQRANHPRSIHSANLRNLRRSHRLLVSNHR